VYRKDAQQHMVGSLNTKGRTMETTREQCADCKTLFLLLLLAMQPTSVCHCSIMIAGNESIDRVMENCVLMFDSMFRSDSARVVESRQVFALEGQRTADDRPG